MKIDIELTEMQKHDIIRELLEDQFANVWASQTTYDESISKETLLESLKNLIYWNSTHFDYEQFLDKYNLEE